MTTKTKTKLKPKKKVNPLNKQLAAEKKIAAEIAKREAAFKKASAPQKRVLIAKDVIAQIKAGRIKPVSGDFVHITSVAPAITHAYSQSQTNFPAECSINHEAAIIYSADKADARETLLKQDIKQCSCCALGGLFLSCTLFNNNTTVSQLASAFEVIADVLDDHDGPEPIISNGLDKFFSVAQLRLIEQTFEGDKGAVIGGDSDAKDKPYPAFTPAASAFYERYPLVKNRLVAIMRNIIKHNGTFKP
jgi:hypothetical protein